jgi:formamidopyrimidine-DNA glycosylase
MPELPEVETIKQQLGEVLPGQAILSVSVLARKSFLGEVRRILKQKIVSVERQAKVLNIGLTGGVHMLIHLKMTGQLIYQPSQEFRDESLEFSENTSKTTGRIVGGHPTEDWIGALPSKHTRVIVELSEGTLYFNDQRLFGWVKVVGSDDLLHEHRNYGPDIIDKKQVTQSYFYAQLQMSKAPIKVVILDQKRMAGVGNIYANDGLFDARINPRRPANNLKRSESDTLLTSLQKVMLLGIKLGGASETNFLHINGMGGKYQEHFLVYKKSGQKCGRKGCDGVIEKIQLGGRGTYFCTQCQK